MEFPLTRNDVVVNDVSFLTALFDEDSWRFLQSRGESVRLTSDRLDRGQDGPREVVPDVEGAVARFRSDPHLAAKFLYTAGVGRVFYWTGAGSDLRVNWGGRYGDGTLGVRMSGGRREGEDAGEVRTVLRGDNLLGVYARDVADALKLSLSENPLPEVLLPPGAVVADYRPAWSRETALDADEREAGGRLLHTEPYVTRLKGTARDGSTGYDTRDEGLSADFQTFASPFGVKGSGARIVLPTQAEASLLYEKALRGELDWNALMDNLTQRGLLSRSLTGRQQESAVRFFRNQFEWLREFIATGGGLKGRRVVAPGLMLADASMGRSVADGVLAPLPAHILAHYMENPLDLFNGSPLMISRALSQEDRRECERLSVGSADGREVRVLVLASPTVGGIQPNASRSPRRASDGSAPVPMKSSDEREEDYLSFSARMDFILSSLPEGVKVTLVAAAGAYGRPGVGVATMVDRYVHEKGGSSVSLRVTGPEGGRRRVLSEGSGEDGLPEALFVERLGDCLPVLTGVKDTVTFADDVKSLDPDYIEVTRQALGEAVSDACVFFSDSADATASARVAAMASYAAAAGLPVVHVVDLQSEESQRAALAVGGEQALNDLFGEPEFSVSLFDDNPRRSWDVSDPLAAVAAEVDAPTQSAYPLVARYYQNTALSVAGRSYHSVLGAYAAFLVREAGLDSDASLLVEASRSEGSFVSMASLLSRVYREGGERLTTEVKERCMRRAVRMMGDVCTDFTSDLLSLGHGPVLSMAAYPGLTGEVFGELFVDAGGNGENRFGVVLASERDRRRSLLEARRREALDERRREEKAYERARKVDMQVRAEGAKSEGGARAVTQDILSRTVLFGGTHFSDGALEHVALSEDGPNCGLSFAPWDDEFGHAPLDRAAVAPDTIRDDVGNEVPNKFFYLFAQTQYRAVHPDASVGGLDSLNLDGITHQDAAGRPYVCTAGIVTRFNSLGNEPGNPDGLPVSYLLDRDNGMLVHSILKADSFARSTSLEKGLTICMLSRQQKDGTTTYPLATSYFSPQMWVRRGVGGEKKWEKVDNPHASAVNLASVNRYVRGLENGSRFPLNCVFLASDDYSFDEGVTDPVDPRSRESARRRFIADFKFALRQTNALAVRMSLPMTFPVRDDGLLDLGGGVPEAFLPDATREVDALLGVRKEVREERVERIDRTAADFAGLYSREFSRDENKTTVFLSPDDLASAFGPFDYKRQAGSPHPVHEMYFRTDDGTVFRVWDPVLSSKLSGEALRSFERHEKPEARRFMVGTTDPSRLSSFIASLQARCEQARGVRVEVRLVGEDDPEVNSLPLDGLVTFPSGASVPEGYVEILSSNSGEMATEPYQYGRRETAFNGDSEFEKRMRGDESDYLGKVDAKDGFYGYVMYRYLLPDGTISSWKPVADLDLALDLALANTRREYSFADPDDRVKNLAPKVSEYRLKALAVQDAYAMNLFIQPAGHEKKKDEERKPDEAKGKDDSAGVKESPAPVKDPDPAESSSLQTVNVWAVTGENAVLSNFAERPFMFRVEEYRLQEFRCVEQGFQYMKTYFSDAPAEVLEGIREGILATVDGKELRALGRSIPGLRIQEWDGVSYHIMESLVRDSFDPMVNPDAAKALLDTGDAVITHRGDRGPWKENFPKILMTVRDELRYRSLPESEKLTRGQGNVYTSYYGNKGLPKEAILVQMSSSRPKGYEVDVEFESLYPDYKGLVKPYKDGKISDDEYSARYRKDVLEVGGKRILDGIRSLRDMGYRQGKDVYLLCWEKPGEFCHRRLVGEFLEKNGIPCPEAEVKQLKKVSKGAAAKEQKGQKELTGKLNL